MQQSTPHWFRNTTNVTNILSGNICSMQERLQGVQDRCAKFGLAQSLDGMNLLRYMHSKERNQVLVVDSSKILYCPMFKVACTTMKSLLLETFGGDSSRIHATGDGRKYWRSFGFTYLTEYRTKELRRILRTYHSVVVVRHPFDRLLSAYYDKFCNDPLFAKKNQLDQLIDAEYYGQLEYDDKGYPRISLQQFLELVATKPEKFTNVHWKNFLDNCNPCVFPFKQIIRMENMENDLKPFLDRLTYPTGSHPIVGVRNDHRSLTNRLQQVTETFRNISSDIIDGLMDRYRLDFEIFGYTWDKEKGAGYHC